MTQFITDAALDLAKVLRKENSQNTIADEISTLVKTHSLIAVGSAWIPVPGADLAAMTANVWTMYVRINKSVGVKLSDNMLKSIGSAIIGNLTSNLLALSAGSILKLIPGASLFTGAMLSAVVYATTVTAAWVYIRALSKFLATGSADTEQLSMCVDEVLNDNAGVKTVFDEAKSGYKK